MKIEEIRGKDSRELEVDIHELRKELFKLRFHASPEEVAKTARFKSIRRTIARIRTVLTERAIAAAAASPS